MSLIMEAIRFSNQRLKSNVFKSATIHPNGIFSASYRLDDRNKSKFLASLYAPYYQTDEEDSVQVIRELSKKIESINFAEPRTRLVIADRSSGLHIGTVNSYWISKETHWLAAGIVIYDSAYWGEGGGKEALSLWIDYLFKARPEIVRLDLQTWSGNQKMMRLAERLGFRMEGSLDLDSIEPNFRESTN